MMTCARCGGELASQHVESFPYTGCGFTVMLGGITVHKCTKCSTCAPEIPNVVGLHKTILRMVATRSAPLAPPEIDFLVDFLRNEGVKVTPLILALVRHWPLRRGRFAEYILRAMALAHLDTGENELLLSASELVRLWPRDATSERPMRWSRRPGETSELHPN
jgi:hypothetical protein